MSFFDNLKYSNKYLLQFHQLPHLLFSSWAMRIFLADKTSYNDNALLEPETMISSYQWMCKYSLYFLDAYLKSDEKAKSFIDKPFLEKRDLFEISYTKALPLPPSELGFAQIIETQGLKAPYLFMKM